MWQFVLRLSPDRPYVMMALDSTRRSDKNSTYCEDSIYFYWLELQRIFYYMDHNHRQMQFC
jgi:hypothetical protein